MLRVTVFAVVVVGLALASIGIPVALANSGDAQVMEGVVVVDSDGEVLVRTRDAVGHPTTNGGGLLKAGQIADGDTVDCLAATGRGHKHRGHVTILK